MSIEPVSFELEEENEKDVKEMADKCRAVSLCIIAPFAPLRIAPSRTLSARFSYPDEFILEEFITKITETYPNKKDRPQLYLLIHSPGGTVSSSYMVARILRKNFDRIIGFIPHIAASGATVLALSCDEIIMGDISRLSGIDPHYELDGETVYPLSIVRAFDHLQDILATKTLGEISYPYQHLVESITAEKYDEATHSLKMVENYANELLGLSGYGEEKRKKVINGVLYDIESHEEVIPLDKAKDIGINAKHYSENTSYSDCWKVMKKWLKNYWLKPSPIHIIKHCLPSESMEASSIKINKANEKKGEV